VLRALNQDHPGGLMNPQTFPAQIFGLRLEIAPWGYSKTDRENKEKGDLD